MKTALRSFPLVAVLLATAWAGYETFAGHTVTIVADADAADLRGGGCGNTWNSKTYVCSGQVACGTVNTQCSSSTLTGTGYENSNTDGDQKQDKTANLQCMVCLGPTINCGNNITYTSATTNCNPSR